MLKNAEGSAGLFISGDISYHALLESRIPVIDAGHFFTAYPVLETLRRWLTGWNLPGVGLPLEEHEYWRQMLDTRSLIPI